MNNLFGRKFYTFCIKLNIVFFEYAARMTQDQCRKAVGSCLSPSMNMENREYLAQNRINQCGLLILCMGGTVPQ